MSVSGVTAPGRTPTPDPDAVAGYRDLVALPGSGFARTYRARRVADGAPVVLKVLAPSVNKKAVGARLPALASLSDRLAGLPHLQAVEAHTRTQDGRLCVVTRDCRGGSLADRLASEGPLSIVEVLNVAVPMALALHALHDLGGCHQGVSPSNILYADTDRSRPVLAELITANLRADDPGVSPYAAPEILAGRPATPRSDVYSLAATLFHLLTSRTPYPGDSGRAALLHRIATGDGAPRIARADAPGALRAAVARGLATDPGARYPDALAFANDLHRVAVEMNLPLSYPVTIWPGFADAGEPAPPTPPAATVRPAEPTPSPPSTGPSERDGLEPPMAAMEAAPAARPAAAPEPWGRIGSAEPTGKFGASAENLPQNSWSVRTASDHPVPVASVGLMSAGNRRAGLRRLGQRSGGARMTLRSPDRCR